MDFIYYLQIVIYTQNQNYLPSVDLADCAESESVQRTVSPRGSRTLQEGENDSAKPDCVFIRKLRTAKYSQNMYKKIAEDGLS